MLLLLLTNSVKLSNEASPIRAHSSSHTYNNWHLKNNNFFVWVQPPLFSKNVHKKKIGRVGGEYHIMRFTTISIFYEKSKFMKELRTAEKGICIRLLHQHTSKSPKLYSEMCLRLLTSVCLCQIFKQANFIGPMQSNEYKSQPTNRRATVNTFVLVATINAK